MTDITTNEKAAGASNTNGLHTDTTGADFRTGMAEPQDLALSNEV